MGVIPVQRLDRPIAGEILVHIHPLPQSRMGRIAWSWLRHPVKSREFPAKHERLVTAQDLLLFGA
ncbi:hypothetical protein H7J83_01060 [Mycobacterium mantenii]|nr:hypothetical protein [Mycobacterium mantenii]